MNPTNIEPLHREHGAYRNWIHHQRNQNFASWKYWTRDKQLASSGNSNRPRKGKRK